MIEFAPARAGDTGCAVVTGGYVALVDVGARTDLVSRLHRSLTGGAATIEQAAAMLATAEPSARFAIARVDTAPVRIALRGDLTVDLGASATTRFAWPADATCVVSEVDDLATLRFALDPADESPHRLPLRDGACPASAVCTTLDDAPPTPDRASKAASSGPPDGDDSGWVLTLADGSELEASPRLVVGRRPWSADGADAQDTGAAYLEAPSPHREISGRHLELTVVADTLHARDLDSTNGTIMRKADAPARLLHEGRDATLEPGDTLDLGEGFLISVARRR
ncbi:FHA domain-containing protein [Demequina capsici]|uniref:FHA domain-containing protein n=1 Tax=Demequina capsici TaxID=3075620 RepID=A0AA96JCX7_9MICO|nr:MULTISPECIES: FHA domain-containing protein [unclassified Demequina]WNM24089.1 FHA domain-containing protein [Demequina sp. OYTSA14]WNM26916.1 FHA domain-containing protein [Demequina sp. PMTSA13]